MTTEKKESVKVTSIDLEILEENNEFVLVYNDKPILTRGGHQIRHNTPRLIEHMISEFESNGFITIKDQVIIEPKIFNAYALYSVQKEFVENGTDNLTENFEKELRSDPTLYRASSPDIWMEQTNRYGFLIDFLNSLKLNLPSLVFPYDDEWLNSNGEEAMALGTLPSEFVEAIYNEFRALEPHRKVVTVYLYNIHSQVLLSALMLAKKKCSANEYANAVITATIRHTAIYGEDTESHISEFAELVKNASTALEYIVAFEDGDPLLLEIREHIRLGEDAKREFKSCKRRNEHEPKNDMKFKRVRAVASFLNTNGGILLIGVEDNGEITGIEEEADFQDNDTFLQSLAHSIKEFLKPLPSTSITADIRLFPYGKSVCIVKCEKRNKSTYLIHKNTSIFVVRNINTTAKLSSTEQIEFIKELSPSEQNEYVARQF